MKFQIRCVDKDGCGTFIHFDADTEESAKEQAATMANEWLKKDRENYKYNLISGFEKYKPIRSIKVVQWDKERQRAVPKGIKFTMRLSSFQATFRNGKKLRNEWYAP
jgi:hypothetical protein